LNVAVKAKLLEVSFYEPTGRGLEARISEKLAYFKALDSERR